MKAVSMLALLALTMGTARADWADLKPGMDAKTAWQCAGAPLIQSKGRATQQWNYDRGGYILFERGRVIAWEHPQAAKPAPVIIARAIRPSPLQLPSKAPVLAAAQ